MAGLFDDLIPNGAPAPAKQAGGMFDDLIPGKPVAMAPPAPMTDRASGMAAERSSAPPSLVQTIEGIVGSGMANSPMNDPEALNAPEMRDPGNTSWGDMLSAIMGVVDQGGRGIAQGVTNVVGLPQSVATLERNVAKWGLNKAGAPQGLVDAVDYVTPAADYMPSAEGMQAGLDRANNATADALGLTRPDPNPSNVAERYANRTAQEIGAMLVPAGGAMSAAERIGIDGARRMGGPIGSFVESFAVNPAKALSNEMRVATGAGMGAATANELFPDSKIADLVGALTGGSLTGIGSVLARGLGNIAGAVFQKENYIDDIVKNAVVDRIGKAADLPGANTTAGVFDAQPLIDAIMKPTGQRPSDVIPGFTETLADRTANPGLAALEYGRAAGPSAGRYVGVRSANNEAVDQVMSALEPKATPGMFRDSVQTERDIRFNNMVSNEQNAAAAADEAARRISPTTTPEQRGGVVRENLEGARDAARARTAEAYDQVGIAGRQVDPAPLAQSLDQALAGLTEVERGLVPQGVIDRVRRLGAPLEDGPQQTGILDASGKPITRPPQGPEQIPLKEATDLKSELQRLQRAALADPRAERGGRNAARALGQMIDTVDGFINSNLSEADQAALDAARGAKFDEAQRFTRTGDPVARALGRYEGGQPQVADNRVAGLFTDPQSMDRLFAQADSPEVRSAIRDEVLSRADTADAGRLNTFLTDNAEQIRRFPGLDAEIRSAAEARTAQAAATTERTNFERIYGTPGKERGTGPVGRYLQYSDANSERAITEVMAAKDPGKAADELMSFVGDNPKAVEGARAAFWQKLKTESQSVDNSQRSMSGKRQWRGDWLKSWLNEPGTAAVAERLYRDNPQDLERLKAYADVLDNVDLRSRGKAAGTSGTSQGVSNIMTPETIQSRMYAWMRGQISGTYLATSMAAVFARRAIRKAQGDAIERLTDDVLLNPKLAEELLKENNPANRAALARKAKGWNADQAATMLNILNEDDNSETKNTIMGGQ